MFFENVWAKSIDFWVFTAWHYFITLHLPKNWRFLHKMLFFIKRKHHQKLTLFKIRRLLENCYFDSKYHFLQWYFGQECHFPSKIYITLGMNSLEKLSNFLRMVLIYLSILGKMTIGFRSILVVNSEKNGNLF